MFEQDISDLLIEIKSQKYKNQVFIKFKNYDSDIQQDIKLFLNKCIIKYDNKKFSMIYDKKYEYEYSDECECCYECAEHCECIDIGKFL